MYETTVNQPVTVAVFLVLQSIQLAGYLSEATPKQKPVLYVA